MTRAALRARARARLHPGERGFTLVELMVALFVLMIIMTSVAYTATIGFKYAGLGRQRETASGYAMKYYQEARALPFNDIKLGLNSTLDPTLGPTYAADTNIIADSTTCASTGASAPCVKVPGAGTTYESLKKTDGAAGNACNPTGTPPTGTPPLCPHQVTDHAADGSSGSQTVYTTRVYVTTPPSSICSSCLRLVVSTSWTSSVVSGAATSVVYQSLMTSTGGGCLGTGSHPYSGPCGAYSNGQAIIPKGTITITPNTSGTSIQNINLGSAVISLPESAANLQSSQISLAQALANTSSAALGLGTSTLTSVGGQYLAVQADNDATLSGATSQTKDLSTVPDTSGSVSAIAQAGSTGTTAAGSCGTTVVNAICITKASSDSTSAAKSTVLDTGTSACTGTTGKLPCGYSASLVGSGATCPGTMSTCVVLHLYNGITDLGTCTLVSIGAPSTASSTQVQQTTGTPAVPQVSTVARNFGQTTFGCIPSLVTPPTNWNVTPSGFSSVGTTNTGFLVALKNGYSERLQAAAGTASPTTSATVSGTEWYYNPGTTTQIGGALTNSLGTASSTWTANGTLFAAVGPTAAGSGTLAAAMTNSTDTFSALGTLTAGITIGCPSSPSSCFNVNETTTPPATPFVINIDSEQMNVTSRKATGTGCNVAGKPCYTVTRGYNGTTAAVHSAAAAVTYRSAIGCPSPCPFNVNETVAPSTATPFNILIGSEQLTVNSRTLVSGSTYTYSASRAAAVTTAASHASGAAFSEVVTTCASPCSFQVTETSTPPATPFTIQVDGEQMTVNTRTLVSGSRYTYSVTRAVNSTTATSHAINATVSYSTAGCASPCGFQVTETSTPPATPFTIQVDSEQMTVNSRTPVSGSTYTYSVTRAVNSTTVASHSARAAVTYFVPYGFSTQVDASPNGAAVSVPILSYTTGGCTYQESMNGTLAPPSGSVGNTSTSGVVTNSSGTLTAPLTGDFKFKVTCGATIVADLDIALNLGTIKATATYSGGAV